MNGNAIRPPMLPVEPEAALEAIETLSRPLVTMRNNFAAGQLETVNKAITIEALDTAIEGCRIAYLSVKRAVANQC